MNEAIAALQRILKTKGHDLGKSGPKRDGVDGDYGAKTRAAHEKEAPGAFSRVTTLDLAPAARDAALLLTVQFPAVRFTSGRRAVPDQARAMAGNVVKNRQWIAQTYVPTAESQRLQLWVSRNPQADTAAEIAAGLAGIMANWTDAEKAHLSKHFSGEAFDVQPVPGPAGTPIKAAIRKLPGVKKFLEKEGGLVRWHAQFA